ncbi:MAG: MtrB/PioB family decaheme-associated outer membrane protein [Gammaproteobacteria bacterium]|nr:MtrB/PioB family decaheme-associated outer membrane protein [Gammaproteobacteria bacterium]
MNNMHHNFTLTTLAAALASLYAANAVAADDDDLIALTKPSSNISLGVGHWSGEREQFGIYDDLLGDDTILLLDADVNKRDDATGTWMTGRIRDGGISNRDGELRYERQGHWGAGLEFEQIPHVTPFTVNTGMSGFGKVNQSVPASADPDADPAAYVPGSGSDKTLKTERTGTGLDGYYYIAPKLNFKFSFKNEDKDGERPWGRGGQAEFAVEPIDSTIRQWEALLDYAGEDLQLNGGYYGSMYDNHNNLVTTLRGDDPDSAYYLSLPLDNQAHQLFLNGGYNFTPTTRATFRVSYTHATQDEDLPTADIAGLAASVAPSHLDGEINTTQAYLGFSAHPLQNLSLNANLRYHKVDERTPDAIIICSPDPTCTDTQVHSTPLDYETTSGSVEGTYRLPLGYSVVGGVEYKNQDRTVPYGSDLDGDGRDDERYVPFRSEVDETTYRLQLRKSLSETLNGSLAYLRSDRDGSSYSDAIHSEGGINPINIADRERDKWRLTLDWMPTANFGLQFNVEDSQDDYGPGSNPYGLIDGSARLYSLDADFVINSDWHLNGWVSYDETKASQFNGRWDRRSEDHEIDRSSDLKDTGLSIGLGLVGQATSRLKVGADLQWTRTVSKYDDQVIAVGENGDPDTGYPDGVSPLEDIESKATKFNLFAEYALEKNSTVRFDLIHEIWDTDDWSWQFSDGSPFVYGTSADGTMVIQDPKQTATFVGVSYRYKF